MKVGNQSTKRRCFRQSIYSLSKKIIGGINEQARKRNTHETSVFVKCENIAADALL